MADLRKMKLFEFKDGNDSAYIVMGEGLREAKKNLRVLLEKDIFPKKCWA